MEKEHKDYRTFLADKYPGKKYHTEDFVDSRPYRQKQLDEIEALIKGRRAESRAVREKFFSPDTRSLVAYRQSTRKGRTQLQSMLGWPLLPRPDTLAAPRAKKQFIGRDDAGSFYRMNITVMPGVSCYGIFATPHHCTAPYPLAILQHGGAGAPENVSGILPYWNYTNMGRRLLEKGFAIFCPQILLWGENLGPKYDRQKIDIQLKQLGGSITALEIFKIQRALDHLLTLKEIDSSKVGMIGLSYGGFYTLFTAAIDLRIKAAASSCFFNDRFIVDWPDWTWLNSGNTFLDTEIARLVCPRPLYIEVGKKDELFDVKHARRLAPEIKKTYQKLKIPGAFEYHEFDGAHEFNHQDHPIDFLIKHLCLG